MHSIMAFCLQAPHFRVEDFTYTFEQLDFIYSGFCVVLCTFHHLQCNKALPSETQITGQHDDTHTASSDVTLFATLPLGCAQDNICNTKSAFGKLGPELPTPRHCKSVLLEKNLCIFSLKCAFSCVTVCNSACLRSD